ncbi:glycerate kinase family protein [Breznakiellaceae bacterium SP9]
MNNVLLIPDSFKGTMSSAEICSIMHAAIKKFYPDAAVQSIPVADGGEGSVEAFLSAVGGTKKTLRVTGPFLDEGDIESFYGILSDGKTAVIEMAAAAGLPLAAQHPDPEKTSTYGAGQLIEAAIMAGCSKIVMGLGGSATNDGGCGAAAALGVQFSGVDGKPFVPTGGTLKDIRHIDIRGINPKLKDIELTSMCDIDNPLFGTGGAAYIFGPQKGATPAMVRSLDAGLRSLAEVVKADLKLDLAEMPGAGAAGGMGYGMKAFLGSALQMGIETVLNTVHFDELLKTADLVFSGEGTIDTQSLRGKVVIGIAKRTQKAGVPLIAVVGDIGDAIDAAYDRGVSAIFSINRVAVEYPLAKLRAKDDLRLTMENIMRFSQVLSTKTAAI